MNTFNYLLSDFLASNLNATYGSDYYVVGKQLVVPLSSTWMLNMSSLETVNKSLCSLDLTKTQKLSSISVNDENLTVFKPPYTNTNFLCAINIKTDRISLTGFDYKFVVFNNNNELKFLNLKNVDKLQVLNILNCQKLSTIEFNELNGTFSSSVSNFSINLFNNKLTNETIDRLYLTLIGGYIYNGQVPFTNANVTICNPFTGSQNLFDVINSYQGLNISLAICGPVIPANFAIAFTVDTTKSEPYNEFTLPLLRSKEYRFKIDWGDRLPGEPVNFVYVAGVSGYTHVYSEPGTYTIKISANPDFPAIFTNYNESASQKISKVSLGSNNIQIFDYDRGFSNCINLTSFFAGLIKTSSVNETWANCQRIKFFPSIDFQDTVSFVRTWANCNNMLQFSTITCNSAVRMNNTWLGCASLTSFPYVTFPNVTSFESTWSGCSGLISFPALDFKSGIRFMGTWRYCTFRTFPPISFPNATNFTACWANNKSLTNFTPISCPKATIFEHTWSNCTALTSFTFNQDTFSKMISGAGCFANVTLPTNTWSAILTSISATNNNYGVRFHGGNSQRNSQGTEAYNYLTNRGWTITDGGQEGALFGINYIITAAGANNNFQLGF